VERVAHGQHRVRPPRGLVVLDVDKQHDGPSNLAALTQFHGQLPPTWSASTGGGGCHLWFRAGGPFRGQLCEGVDIKAHTGYLVVPPSVHPNGTCYVWDNDLPIVDAPEWILPLLCTPRTPVRPPSPAGDGMRASGLVRLSLVLRSAVEIVSCTGLPAELPSAVLPPACWSRSVTQLGQLACPTRRSTAPSPAHSGG